MIQQVDVSKWYTQIVISVIYCGHNRNKQFKLFSVDSWSISRSLKKCQKNTIHTIRSAGLNWICFTTAEENHLNKTEYVWSLKLWYWIIQPFFCFWYLYKIKLINLLGKPCGDRRKSLCPDNMAGHKLDGRLLYLLLCHL
jgi:hypothetical protein